jgi:hypothetical protein
MSEANFSVKNHGVLRVSLEPTGIVGTGSAAFPTLILQLKLRVLPVQQQSVVNYTLLRLAGKLSVGNENTDLARFEAPPLAETSSPNPYERPLHLAVPLDIRQVKHIGELRDGKDLFFKITLTGLVMFDSNGGFERLQDTDLQLAVPRSHWIDRGLNAWNISDLRLLEINSPADGRKEVVSAIARLARAEQFYRTGDYPHVLTELRSAFAAIAEKYSAQQADKNTFEKMLVNTHPKVREKLREAFHDFCAFLNLGPHEPSPTSEVPAPISRHDARFALVTAHAIFEYFASENWPGI